MYYTNDKKVIKKTITYIFKVYFKIREKYF